MTISKSQEGFRWDADGKTTQGLLTRSVVPSTRQLRSSYDAIVIGAGFSGLIAARELSDTAGTEVLLVEARDRIGGRTWTANEMGEDIEMGGTWVHWNQPHVFSELTRYGLDKALKPTTASVNPAQSLHNFGNGLEDAPAGFLDTIEKITRDFFAIDGLSSRELLPWPHDPYRQPALWRKYDSLSAKQRLDQLSLPAKEKEIFSCYIGLFGCCSLDDTSFFEILRWYALSGHSISGVYEYTTTYKLGHGGMTSFARSILAEYTGDRIFSTPVVEVNQDGSSAHVVTSGGQRITAKVIVCTVPLNCLTDVKFSPPLSTLRSEAARHGHQNKGSKYHFKLGSQDPMWFATASIDSPTPYLLAFADHNGTNESSRGTYVVVAGKTDGVPDHKDAKFVVENFKNTFKKDGQVQAYLVHDWATDPYAKGEWSCWAPNAMTKFHAELQRPHGRVLFASADWANGWRGFIDGALECGKSAASSAQALLNTSAPARL